MGGSYVLGFHLTWVFLPLISEHPFVCAWPWLFFELSYGVDCNQLDMAFFRRPGRDQMLATDVSTSRVCTSRITITCGKTRVHYCVRNKALKALWNETAQWVKTLSPSLTTWAGSSGPRVGENQLYKVVLNDFHTAPWHTHTSYTQF